MLSRFLSTTALISIAAIAGMGLTPAFAQEVPADQDAPQDLQSETEIESGQATTQEAQPAEAPADIVVTGSRIRRPNLESTVPVTSVGGEEFFETGQVSVGDVLNELPSLRSTFSQGNSTRFLGTSGLNLLDLRGLSTQRTLVLVNGRRHVPGDILNFASSPDVNTFPTDLIERVDVVTGGNSAIYGSDAIAGVVNFVLRRDYEGIGLRGQGGVSKYGDAGSYFVSAVAGTNFGDGRGNIAINAEYAHQNEFFAAGRPWLARNNGFLIVDTDIGCAPGETTGCDPNVVNGSDGIPDRAFFRDIRSATYTNTGLVRFGGTGTLNCGTDPTGAFYNCPYTFLPDGTLVPITGARAGIGPNGSFIGGNGESFRGGRQFQLGPTLDRYLVNVIGHFAISDAFEPFIEAKYAHTKSSGTGNGGPAFISGTTLGDIREQPRLDNPFLSEQARALITEQLTLANGVAPAPDARFSLRENLLGLGERRENPTRKTYRGVIGVRGDFNDDWQYEVSANYGEFREDTEILGNLNVQRFLLALDAAPDPATGNIVCRSSFDPAARVGYVDEGEIFAADVAACVPLNPFGGQISPQARQYVLTDTISRGKITQLVFNGFVSGDTSQWFELPGGAIGFAVGAEYRRETAKYQQDPLVEQGYTFYNVIPTFDPPAFEVKEAFGELRLPILANKRFFDELTLSGAIRVADYKLGSTGTVLAYNAGLDWAPVRDIRFRGNYSRAVRAPNTVELYTPLGQNFAPGFVDPCALNQINTGSPERAANCRAAGVPADFNFIYSQSLQTIAGGNPDLKAETSDSFTVGAVIQPRWVQGLSLSVDYYDIKVNDVITTPTAQQIANACYDAATLQNQFCAQFERAGPEGGPNGEEPFQIIEGSLQQISLNYAKLKTRGLDVEAAYRRRIEGFGEVNTRLTYTHVFQNDQYLFPEDPNRADQILLELGDPKDAFNWNLDVKNGPVTVGYKMRYIGRMVLNQYEDFFSKQGRPPQDADYADRRYYPSVFYHDARLGYDVTDNFNFYAGVDNVTNRKPPLGLTGIGSGSAIYDVRGRFFYAGGVAKF